MSERHFLDCLSFPDPLIPFEFVKKYGWAKLVQRRGLVKSPDGRKCYTTPEYAESIKKRMAENERETATRKREREELEAAANVGRARMAYEAALAGAGVPVAPDAPAPVAPEVTTPAAEEEPKRKRGRPKAAHSSPQARARAAAYVAMVEYAEKHPGLSGAGARRDCAEEHEGEADYQYFVNDENAKKWGQRHGVQFSALVEMCRHDAEAWADKKATLTN